MSPWLLGLIGLGVYLLLPKPKEVAGSGDSPVRKLLPLSPATKVPGDVEMFAKVLELKQYLIKAKGVPAEEAEAKFADIVPHLTRAN
jgi:hypothetical protein